MSLSVFSLRCACQGSSELDLRTFSLGWHRIVLILHSRYLGSGIFPTAITEIHLDLLNEIDVTNDLVALKYYKYFFNIKKASFYNLFLGWSGNDQTSESMRRQQKFRPILIFAIFCHTTHAQRTHASVCVIICLFTDGLCSCLYIQTFNKFWEWCFMLFHSQAGRRGCIVNVVLLPAAQSQTPSGERLFRDSRSRGSRLLITFFYWIKATVSPKRRWVCHYSESVATRHGQMNIA